MTAVCIILEKKYTYSRWIADRLEADDESGTGQWVGVNGEPRLLGREEEAIEVQQSRQFGTGAVPVKLGEGMVYQYRISMV